MEQRDFANWDNVFQDIWCRELMRRVAQLTSGIKLNGINPVWKISLHTFTLL